MGEHAEKPFSWYERTCSCLSQYSSALSLVNYRRQSITPKIDPYSDSRKTSIITVINVSSADPTASARDDEVNLAAEGESNRCQLDSDPTTVDKVSEIPTVLSPILSPNQRSLILHQWREIMSEEIFLRQYQQHLERQQMLLDDLETNLKVLKTKIFCTNNESYLHRQRSLTNIDQLDENRHVHLPARSRSLQSLTSMPASWILAVQSAAYSDVLDGTSEKTTERAILFNKEFFDQLQHCKEDRRRLQEDSLRGLRSITHVK